MSLNENSEKSDEYTPVPSIAPETTQIRTTSNPKLVFVASIPGIASNSFVDKGLDICIKYIMNHIIWLG